MSRNKILSALLLVLLSFTYTGCDDPPDEETATFVLDMKAMVNDSAFVLGQTYQNAQDYKFNIETLRFYLSNLILTGADGSEVEVKDVDFLNFENNHSTSQSKGEQVTGTIPAGAYTSLRFAIGVDSTRNSDDPAQYPSSHPLSIYNGSHWNWNTGYIFLKIEGSIDSTANGSGNFGNSFLYHTGTNPLYHEIQFSDDFTVAPAETFEYKMKLDVNRFFYNDSDTLDAVNDNFTHTTGTFRIAERVTDFFSGAFSKR
ncbi:MAG: MbnP family protein [Chitinophagales bacterium]|nr:MbnP family protein [Chitinophagales bacterium]